MHICTNIRSSIGVKEDDDAKLRSILAQFEYKQLVEYWEKRGVPFATYFYVPETHPITQTEFHERDDAHVLKVEHLHVLVC